MKTMDEFFKEHNDYFGYGIYVGRTDLPLVDIWFSSGVALSQSVITWLIKGESYE